MKKGVLRDSMEKEVNVMNIDGKEFFLVDVIDKYHYFSETANPENICILKEKYENDEMYLVSLKDVEVDKALLLYGKKYEDTSN